jgi:hypothetical protein
MIGRRERTKAANRAALLDAAVVDATGAAARRRVRVARTSPSS